MPTYEYKCQECGHLFEAFQLISEKPLKRCPVCKGPVKRLISSGVGLIFKGSGFYITDYKNKESAKQVEDGGSGKGKEDSSKKKDSSKKQDEGKRKDSSSKE